VLGKKLKHGGDEKGEKFILHKSGGGSHFNGRSELKAVVQEKSKEGESRSRRGRERKPRRFCLFKGKKLTRESRGEEDGARYKGEY